MVIETYFNGNSYDPPSVINANNRSIGLDKTKVSLNNGVLTCSLNRKINIQTISDKFYDLNNKYYLLVAKGPLQGINLYTIRHNLNSSI